MKKTTKITGIIAILVILSGALITACGAGAPATPTTDPGAVYTMAAATVQAQLTQAAAQNPTAVPATATTAPTQKPTVAPTIGMAQQPTPPFGQVATLSTGATIPTLSSGLNPNLVPTSAQPAGFKFGDVAEFQYNIPADGTVFAPGVYFQMEVGFKNVGSVVWTTDYSLRFTGGTQMSGVTVVPLKVAVQPGEKAIFNVDLHTPGEPNSDKNPQYMSYWQLTTQTGSAVANGSMYSKIIVKREY